MRWIDYKPTVKNKTSGNRGDGAFNPLENIRTSVRNSRLQGWREP